MVWQPTLYCAAHYSSILFFTAVYRRALFKTIPLPQRLRLLDSLRVRLHDFPAEFYGFAVSKQQPELLASINKTLANMKADGQYQTLVSAHIK